MLNTDHILNARILVVDDDADNREMVVEILKMAGYLRVDTLADATRVQAEHVTHAYDLILLDMHMPGLHGLDVMAELKQIETSGYLPVLAITGDPRLKIAALEAGARDFLTKPYDLLELQKRVYNMLEVRLLYKVVAQQAREQKELALHDSLTELPNRRLLEDRLEKAMQHSNRTNDMIALMYLDLDGFKKVNDEHGHPTGDLLLKQVADRIRSATRREDTIARLGGDEFVILLSDLNGMSDVMRPASSLLHLLAKPYEIGGNALRVTASIGVAFYSGGAEGVGSLISRADKALYDAKNSGKNRYCFSDVAAWAASVA